MEEKYKELADAGFTINLSYSFCVGATAGANDSRLELLSSANSPVVFRTLDVAAAHNLTMWVDYRVLDNYAPAELARLKAHPALQGYYIQDEPWAGIFADMETIVQHVRAIDDTHPCYINLLPGYSEWIGEGEPFRNYIHNYLTAVSTPFLSFDHYPVVMENEVRVVRANYYSDLEIVSDECKKVDKPFWGFALSIPHYDYPTPTLADLRLQVYSNLAYGAQCIEYFTYWVASSLGALAPIDASGNKTEIYYLVQQMNREIKARSAVFLGAKVLWTAHTGSSIPMHCTELDKSQLPEAIQSLEISEPGALVSLMEKGDDRFLVVVNRNLTEEIRVKAVGSSTLHQVLRNGSVEPVTFGLTVDPGDALIYFWKN